MLSIVRRMYAIADFLCKPHHQYQNPVEQRVQEVKKMTNAVMDRTNTPPDLRLLCIQHTVYNLNRLSVASLNWKTPLLKLRCFSVSLFILS
jgi:hypothetical protein